MQTNCQPIERGDDPRLAARLNPDRRREIPTLAGLTAPTDENWGRCLHALRVTEIPADRRALHRHRYFEVFWFNRGHGEHLNDFKWYPIATGTLVFVSIGQVHAWNPVAGLSGFVAAFSPGDIGESVARPGLLLEAPFFFGLSRPPTLPVPPAFWPEFDQLFESLIAELASKDPLRHEAARALLRLALIRAQRLCAQPCGTNHTVSAATRLARNFLLELERSFLTVRRVRDYAVRLQVSPNHLVETVRENVGQTPGELLDVRLFLEAKRLLIHTTRSVSEIAYLLDFKNPSHFGHFFKRHSGYPPGQARERFGVNP